MALLLEDCPRKIQEAIKNQVEFENEWTGYDMELTEEMTWVDDYIFYHMSREIDYEDYKVKIRNQGEYKFEDNSGEPRGCYAYEIIITSRLEFGPEIKYKLSDMATKLGYHGELPTWEAIESFFESEEIEQMFAKHRQSYENFIALVKSDSRKEDEGEETQCQSH